MSGRGVRLGKTPIVPVRADQLNLARLLYSNPLARIVLAYSRNEKIKILRSLLPETRVIRVLDVGTGAEDEVAQNVIFQQLRDRGRFSIVGVVYDEPVAPIRARYADARFVVGSGTALPFTDDSFDLAHANAVIEHVIGECNRRIFIAEMLRVAPLVFVTTPNRYFPIEVHTRLPFVHWLPAWMHNSVVRMIGSHALRGTYFEPLSAKQLKLLFPSGVRVRITSPGIPGMTLVAIARR